MLTPHKCTWLSQDCGRLYFLLKPSRKRHHVALCATRGAPMKAWTRKVEQASSQCDILEMCLVLGLYLSPRPKINLGFSMTRSKTNWHGIGERIFFHSLCRPSGKMHFHRERSKRGPVFRVRCPGARPPFPHFGNGHFLLRRGSRVMKFSHVRTDLNKSMGSVSSLFPPDAASQVPRGPGPV